MSGWTDLRPLERRWVAVSLVGIALLTADVLSSGLLTHADSWLRGLVQPWGHAPFWAEAVGRLGDLGVAAALMAMAGAVLAQVSWRLWPIVLVTVNFVVTEAVVLALKTAVGRPGPGVWVDRVGYPGYFPSGHAATSAVCVGTVVFLLMTVQADAGRTERAPTVAMRLGLGVGVVVGIGAVLADQHWVTDGIGGLLVAALVLTVSLAISRNFLSAARPVAGDG